MKTLIALSIALLLTGCSSQKIDNSPDAVECVTHLMDRFDIELYEFTDSKLNDIAKFRIESFGPGTRTIAFWHGDIGKPGFRNLGGCTFEGSKVKFVMHNGRSIAL